MSKLRISSCDSLVCLFRSAQGHLVHEDRTAEAKLATGLQRPARWSDSLRILRNQRPAGPGPCECTSRSEVIAAAPVNQPSIGQRNSTTVTRPSLSLPRTGPKTATRRVPGESGPRGARRVRPAGERRAGRAPRTQRPRRPASGPTARGGSIALALCHPLPGRAVRQLERLQLQPLVLRCRAALASALGSASHTLHVTPAQRRTPAKVPEAVRRRPARRRAGGGRQLEGTIPSLARLTDVGGVGQLHGLHQHQVAHLEHLEHRVDPASVGFAFRSTCAAASSTRAVVSGSIRCIRCAQCAGGSPHTARSSRGRESQRWIPARRPTKNGVRRLKPAWRDGELGERGVTISVVLAAIGVGAQHAADQAVCPLQLGLGLGLFVVGQAGTVLLMHSAPD